MSTTDGAAKFQGESGKDAHGQGCGLASRPAWLDEAVFYEIYPQSFYDSDGDGIGDIPGIMQKLDYVRDLGCNTVWINPCYDSPFKDAGYDVRDYCKVAERYGTNDDLIALFEAAHERGMHVLLDLVPGHTSEEHAWFEQSKQADRNEFSDRYIWTGGAFQGYSMPFISGESDRDAAYILNFFKCQPALNYGFARRDQPWQMSPDSPAAQATRAAMVEVMRFWLSRGCDGFRVDMANSLVKNDDDAKSATIAAWREMLGVIKSEYPESAFVSEWGVPDQAMKAGFDMDFYLDWRWDGKPNGYNLLARNVDDTLDAMHDLSYFSARGGSSACEFLGQYVPQYEATRGDGYFCFITCNHDTPRLAPRLSDRERRVAYGMLLTMPGVPYLYYGDEIGMRYRILPTKEGGYARTGSRTPMQWDGAAANLGFSEADPGSLYLPVDPGPDAPTVAEQDSDDSSMLSWVRAVLALRAEHGALRASGRFSVLAAPEDGRSLVIERVDASGGKNGEQADCERLIIALNPSLAEERINLGDLEFDLAHAQLLLAVGELHVDASLEIATEAGVGASTESPAGTTADGCGQMLVLGPQSFGVFAC
ncbi:alpha-amylase family glycosyl hydrolase [Bifidobacterium sp.]|jgi:maltose alpha-D-glucosyltransferase/alpha-amylase|uniref:alpha-amylase family glycosyl hydrolase n=1 Tax=Bifidobacterium sp. TaxID=41200 RepID=UPI0025C25203|nr:alpha-amylase family glycosyl hydrolase [Bifidobacterium sp.]MCH4210103.1 alpha-amylase family glycosyl hydrolase [Bifidobacterium sp.]MCI1225559.1 alpha-amylase family glycosyl hydrolase [Bifidobacterium sp.]